MAALRTLMAAASTLAVLSSSVAIAQSTVPDITGHWDAVEGSGAIYGGEMWTEMSGTVALEITEQTGHAFIGTFNWAFPSEEDDDHHDGTENTHQASEDMLGVFTGDGASFIIADHPDTSMMFGSVLDHNRLEVIMVESGEFAFAERLIYERRQQ
ncbi:MAG: hypothetical protein AAF414_09380 [Pseudomonadota bacterium]